ncbi:MAG: hypothetical protein OXQ29_06845, partial [Rhodospirillaceae bacterium]|nr:hypothetical protein [Rhodospirillaceae bacterium]
PPNVYEEAMNGLKRGVSDFARTRRALLVGAVLAALLLAASPAPANTLAAPTLSAEAGNRWVRFTWTESYSATDYEWRESTDGGATWGAWNHMLEDAARHRRGTLGGLTNGVTYTFQVRAVKESLSPFGDIQITEYSDPSNAVTVTPSA